MKAFSKKTSNKRTGTSTNRASRTKRASRGSKQKTRYYVKSDNRVVTAYKKENGPGYVYHKRTPTGVRNVPIQGTTFKTERDAKKRAQANRERGRK